LNLESETQPVPVDLLDHDPAWFGQAEAEAERIRATIGTVMTGIHHIGSTAIPGIRAKPILDLLPVVISHTEFDSFRPALEALGYMWWGEYGLPGRRYCSLNDPKTGARKVHLHCYERDNPEIARHVVFRDYLIAHPAIARAYEAEKIRCRESHPLDSHAYSDCKNAWIRKTELEALAWNDRIS
jgi:GrpB-like predicted nucleotidyltransferase (UPF0157 family)